MNRKISLGIAISIAAIACAVTFVITMTVSLNNYNDKIADVQQRGEIYTKLQETDSFVRSYSLFDVDDDKMKIGVYSGYLKGLDDSRARYYTTDEYYYKTQTESGRLTGLGMEYEREESGYVRVNNVYKGSPADAGGIQTGDIIISVGSVSVLETGYETAVSALLYGDEGTKQKFAVRRNGEEKEYELSRVMFDIPSVNGMLLDNGIMYLKFYNINDAADEKLTQALDHGSDAQITGYIIDLRGCSSGVYTSVSAILEHFLPARNIAAAVYRNSSTRIIVQTQNDEHTALPIGVLTDERTGGSAELIAQALVTHAGAQTFGETTMGYATLQETKVFSDGTAAEISVAAIKPYDENEEINDSADYGGKGIVPEFVVEYDGAYEADPFAYAQTQDVQLKKAIEVITSKTIPEA